MTRVTAEMVFNTSNYVMTMLFKKGDLNEAVEQAVAYFCLKYNLNNQETERLRQKVYENIGEIAEENHVPKKT